MIIRSLYYITSFFLVAASSREVDDPCHETRKRALKHRGLGFRVTLNPTKKPLWGHVQGVTGGTF